MKKTKKKTHLSIFNIEECLELFRIAVARAKKENKKVKKRTKK
jgi:hypothetical protein